LDNKIFVILIEPKANRRISYSSRDVSWFKANPVFRDLSAARPKAFQHRFLCSAQIAMSSPPGLRFAQDDRLWSLTHINIRHFHHGLGAVVDRQFLHDGGDVGFNVGFW